MTLSDGTNTFVLTAVSTEPALVNHASTATYKGTPTNTGTFSADVTVTNTGVNVLEGTLTVRVSNAIDVYEIDMKNAPDSVKSTVTEIEVLSSAALSETPYWDNGRLLVPLSSTAGTINVNLTLSSDLTLTNALTLSRNLSWVSLLYGDTLYPVVQIINSGSASAASFANVAATTTFSVTGTATNANNTTVDIDIPFKVTATSDNNVSGPGSSSGGCNAGFGILGLALAGTLFARKRG